MNPILSCLFYEFSFNKFSNLYNVFIASVFSDLYFLRLIWQLHFMKAIFIKFSLFFREEKEKGRRICEVLSFLLCSSPSFSLLSGWVSKFSQRDHSPLFTNTESKIHEAQINKETKTSLHVDEFRDNPEGPWTAVNKATRSNLHSIKIALVAIICLVAITFEEEGGTQFRRLL